MDDTQETVWGGPGASSGRRTMLTPFPRCCISSSKSFGELTAFRSSIQPKHDEVEQSKPQTHRTRTQAVILGHRWSRHRQHNRSWLTLCFYSKTIEPLMLSQGCESVPRNITNKLIIISSHEQSCTRSPSCAVLLSQPNVRNLYVNSEARENFDL